LIEFLLDKSLTVLEDITAHLDVIIPVFSTETIEVLIDSRVISEGLTIKIRGDTSDDVSVHDSLLFLSSILYLLSFTADMIENKTKLTISSS
jgi:hypothetical protein